MDPFGHFWLQRSATKIEKLIRVKFDAMDDIFLKIYASYTSYIHDFVANLDDVVTCHATKRLMHPFEVFVVGKHLCKNHHRSQTCHSKVAETEGWLLNGVGRNMAGNQRGAGIGNLLACGARVEIC